MTPPPLAGGFATPTGTITFRLYGPDDATCTGAVTFHLGGGGERQRQLRLGVFTTAAAGTYRWTADYSGDTNNNPASGPCNAPGQSVTVSAATPTVTASSATVAAGSAVTATWSGIAGPTATDWVGLYPSTATADSGFVAWAYTGGGASGTKALTVPPGTRRGPG